MSFVRLLSYSGIMGNADVNMQEHIVNSQERIRSIRITYGICGSHSVGGEFRNSRPPCACSQCTDWPLTVRWRRHRCTQLKYKHSTVCVIIIIISTHHLSLSLFVDWADDQCGSLLAVATKSHSLAQFLRWSRFVLTV